MPATVSLGLPDPTVRTTVTKLSDCGNIGADPTIMAILLWLNGTCIGYSWIEGFGFFNINNTATKAFASYVRVYGSTSCTECGTTEAARRTIMELSK